MLEVGDSAPDFTGHDQDGAERRLRDYRGRKLVLYFYPKDMTSGCTVEACDFRDNLKRLVGHGAEILGVSADSAARHRKFIAKESLNFPLLADEEHAIADAYGVWVEKSMYGRKYMGIERSTFIIDEQGRLAAIFRKVKVAGHVDEVLHALAG